MNHPRRSTQVKLASLEAIARALNAADVPWLIGDGLAVNAHGYGRLTQDRDILIELEPGVIRSAFAALAGLGYRPRVPVTAESFADPEQRRRWRTEKGMVVLPFDSGTHPETPIDLFVEVPFDFSEEHRLALVEQVAPGIPVRILRLASLLRMKESAGRPQDLADIAELRRLHGDAPHE